MMHSICPKCEKKKKRGGNFESKDKEWSDKSGLQQKHLRAFFQLQSPALCEENFIYPLISFRSASRTLSQLQYH